MRLIQSENTFSYRKNEVRFLWCSCNSTNIQMTQPHRAHTRRQQPNRIENSWYIEWPAINNKKKLLNARKWRLRRGKQRETWVHLYIKFVILSNMSDLTIKHSPVKNLLNSMKNRDNIRFNSASTSSYQFDSNERLFHFT